VPRKEGLHKRALNAHNCHDREKRMEETPSGLVQPGGKQKEQKVNGTALKED
jgi:hypothetical protein